MRILPLLSCAGLVMSTLFGFSQAGHEVKVFQLPAQSNVLNLAVDDSIVNPLDLINASAFNYEVFISDVDSLSTDSIRVDILEGTSTVLQGAFEFDVSPSAPLTFSRDGADVLLGIGSNELLSAFTCEVILYYEDGSSESIQREFPEQ